MTHLRSGVQGAMVASDAFRPVLRLFSQMQRRLEPLLSLRGAAGDAAIRSEAVTLQRILRIPTLTPFARNDALLRKKQGLDLLVEFVEKLFQ